MVTERSGDLGYGDRERRTHPRLAALSRRVLRSKKCNPCLRKVLLGQGESPVALQDTTDRDWKE